MKNYTITVNGNVYDVVVEEGASTGAPVAAPAAPKAVPKAAPKPAAAPAASGAAGSVRVEAGAAGKVFAVEVVLEAMKMEIPVVAPQDGTIATVDVSVGDPVEAGALLATLN